MQAAVCITDGIGTLAMQRPHKRSSGEHVHLCGSRLSSPPPPKPLGDWERLEHLFGRSSSIVLPHNGTYRPMGQNVQQDIPPGIHWKTRQALLDPKFHTVIV
jgi:hypothetical protein